jgi:hypothetical protein
MMRNLLALLIAAPLAGCTTTPPRPQQDLGSVAIVASPYEPAAQFNGSNANYADGAVIGGVGGAGIGALSAQASGGLLCTLGGPLCLIVVVPAAIVGGLVGGIAGAALDAITTDPGGRIAEARGAIEQAIADMRLTDALAARTSEQLALPLVKTGELSRQTVLEIGVSDLKILAREKEMALVLRARSRLYRAADGEVIEERVSEAQTDFRKYQDWAADGAQPLRRAVDAALADLSRSIVSARLESLPRPYTSARRGG